MNEYQFPPLKDKIHFPLLTAGDELPCGDLIGCESLVFFALEGLSSSASIILREGTEWHLYGDTRWPALSSWLEINTSPAGYPGYSGVLVMTYDILDEGIDPFDWVAHNNPLSQIFPEERSDAAVKRRLEMLRKAASTKNVAEPADSVPQYVQSYCIYRTRSAVRQIARYTDLLNSKGITETTVAPETANSMHFALLLKVNTRESESVGRAYLRKPLTKSESDMVFLRVRIGDAAIGVAKDME